MGNLGGAFDGEMDGLLVAEIGRLLSQGSVDEMDAPVGQRSRRVSQ
jgi:hypothetical protein